MTLHRSSFRLGLGPSARFGGESFSPGDLSPLFWFDSDSTYITETGTGVSLWQNRGSYAGNAIQGTDAQRPTYLPAGGVNGYPGVQFVQVNNDWLDMGTVVEPSSDITIFVVANFPSLVGFHAIIYFGTTFALFFKFLDSTYLYTGPYEIVIPPATGEQILAFQYDDTLLTCDSYKNGSLIKTALNNNARTWGAAGIAAANFADMTLSEMIIYNNLLAPADFTLVSDFLASKYSIP